MKSTEDPILYLGLDIATKRDTCALTAITPIRHTEEFHLWGYRIWEPPVNLVTQVEPLLLRLFQTQRVACLLYDPTQASATIQRLALEGYEHKLIEVNQATQMTKAANTLHQMCTESRLKLINSADIKAHFSWANAKQTERGWRIVKMGATKPIDFVVSLAMSLSGATGELGWAVHRAFDPDTHVRSIGVIP